MKIKNMKNVKIKNFVDFSNWDLTEKEVREYIYNLNLNDIQIDDYNTFRFINYNANVDVLIYFNRFGELICIIEAIY